MMYRLRDEGKIRCIGLSAYTERDFARLVPGIKPSVVQSRANIMDYHFITKNSVLMKLCEKYPMSFIAFSPLNEGVVLGKYSSAHPPKFSEGDHRQSSEKYRPEYLARAEKGIAAVGGTLGNNTEDLARMALQFILYHDYVAGVIPGFRNESQVAVNLAGADKPLKGNQIALIRKAFA
jgi:aryl-alcohol dehydrogenase-like predicted oxidoreductase